MMVRVSSFFDWQQPKQLRKYNGLCVSVKKNAALVKRIQGAKISHHKQITTFVTGFAPRYGRTNVLRKVCGTRHFSLDLLNKRKCIPIKAAQTLMKLG